MNKFLMLICLFFVIHSNAQESKIFYFDKNDRLVLSEENATKRKEIKNISDRKFEIVEASKSQKGWVENGKKEVVTRKKDKYFITRDIYGLGLNTAISVVDTLPDGFLIREYFDGFCFREAEVKMVFPLVLNGKCTNFPKTKRDQLDVCYYWNNSKYSEFQQPVGVEDDSVTIDSKLKPDRWPLYPGGSRQFFEDINNLIKKTMNFRVKNISGVVWVSATINTDGKMEKVGLVKGVHPQIDSLLVKSVSHFNDTWKPAIINGEVANYEYYLPFEFFVKGLEEKKSTERVYLIVDQMPVYPGGMDKLKDDVAKNIHYPLEAQKQKIEGKVFVNFIVDKEGHIRNVRVARGVHPLLNDEAIKVVYSLSDWIPGMYKGEKVCVSYTVPINFVLKN